MQESKSMTSHGILHKSVKFSIETSMTETKPVVIEKQEFEFREETLSQGTF